MAYTDISVFMHGTEEDTIVISVHVDDTNIMSASLPQVLWLKCHLQKEFRIVDDGPTSHFLKNRSCSGYWKKNLLNQQKNIRKIMFTFDKFLPKSKKDEEEFVLMHYTPTIFPSSFQNISHVDEPVIAEDKELMSKLP